MMKKLILLVFTGICFTSGTAFAQKVGYIDSKYVLGKMPEYGAAQQELDQMAASWQKELEDKYKKIDKMQTDLQAEEVLLTDDVKQIKKEAISQSELEAKEFQKKKFGKDGELFLMRKDKVAPIQEKVYKAIEAAAKEKRIDIVFDKSGGAQILYTNALFDLSDLVLTKLGVQASDKSKSNVPDRNQPGDRNTPGDKNTPGKR